MNLRRNRSLPALFSLALVAFVLCACAAALPKTPAPTRPPAAPESSQKAAEATRTALPQPTPTAADAFAGELASLRGVKVALWHPFAGEVGRLLEEMAGEFSRANEWGIRAEAVSLGGSGALAQALNRPDGALLPQAVLAPSAQLNGWLGEGRLVDLNGYLSQPEVGIGANQLKDYNPLYWQQDQTGEAQAGIPALRTAYGLIYNRAWAAELGFQNPPATPAEFKEQACAAAKVNNRSEYLDKRGTGGWLVDLSPEVALAWLEAFGAQVLPASPSEAFRFDRPEAEDALAFLHEMQAEGCLWLGKSPTPYDYFAGRYALFISGSLQDLAPVQKTLQNLENGDDWAFIAYPSQAGRAFVLAEGYSFGVYRGEPRAQLAAWLFVRWLSLPENQSRLEGVYPSLPVGVGRESLQAGDAAEFPWTHILPLEKQAVRPAPSLPSWVVVRRPLADAYWQVFNLAAPEQLKDILPELDRLAAGLLAP